jgi:hypothetical protein
MQKNYVCIFTPTWYLLGVKIYSIDTDFDTLERNITSIGMISLIWYHHTSGNCRSFLLRWLVLAGSVSDRTSRTFLSASQASNQPSYRHQVRAKNRAKQASQPTKARAARRTSIAPARRVQPQPQSFHRLPNKPYPPPAAATKVGITS